MEIVFEWDQKKSDSNMKKHGITFEEASSVFYDSNALEYFDAEHSEIEDRFLMMGLSDTLRLLLVSYTVKKTKNAIIIRIISSRKATKNEAQQYKG